MIEHSEVITPLDVTIPSADGTLLKAWHWPRDEPRGIIVISHGIGEHGGCYKHVAECLSPRLSVDVVSFDYRGHGRSPGRRGYVRRYDDLIDDLRAVLDWSSRVRPVMPRFVLAHSNGGQVALRAALAGVAIDGLILSNPCLRLAMRVPIHKRMFGQLLRRCAPGVTLGTEVADELMVRDAAQIANRRTDTLRHTRISAPLFFGMLEGGLRLSDRAGEIQTPVLMLLSTSDTVVDPVASQDLFEKLGSVRKTLRLYPEALHEPLNDLDREQVLDDVANWVDELLRSPRR
jgi:alpha-beta hydrolase superfamily lysophospholipase